MPSRAILSIASAALLLELLSVVGAHGDEYNGETMDMSPHNGQPPAVQHDGVLQSYWSLSEHVSLMYWHIALELLAWVVVLPIAAMLSIARSRLTIPSQLAFLAINAIALLFGIVYNQRTPETYANNSHSKVGWAFTWLASAWVLMAIINVYARRPQAHAAEHDATQPMTTVNMARYQRVHYDELVAPSRWSNDSGQGTERNSASLYGHSRSPSEESEEQYFTGPTRRYTHDDVDLLENDSEKHSFLRNSSVHRFFSRNVARFTAGRTLQVMRLLYVVIERTVIIQGLVAISTGAVVYCGIGRGGAVFNVLAHFVKGGIFFLYGLLTLGRWTGQFADFGWAWNVKPPKQVVGRWKEAFPSAEFIESFVIWLYGVIDVFLEHLAAWGDEWAPQDLEHVSISVMFFGGGLLGMIIESKTMRRLLNTTVVSLQSKSEAGSWQEPSHYRTSMNPMPALIIMLLGKMMSSHHQDSMVSAMIHGQWGTMFMGFALARGLTYVVLYLAPPTSYLPSRPPTELIASFCLISGGITFVLSNKDTVAVLESYNLDAMFVFTITMGLTALIMAWTTVLIAFKGWALRKEISNKHAKTLSGVLA